MNVREVTAPQPPPAPDLTGGERRQLVEALLDAFDEDGLRRVARYHLEEDLDEVAGGDNLEEVAFNLVEWAAREGRMPGLVAGALAENPGSPELRRFELEVWKKPRPSPKVVQLRTHLSGAEPSAVPEARSRADRRWKGTPKVLVPLVVVAIAAGALGLLWSMLSDGPPPEVEVANAALTQIRTDPELGEVFDVSFDYSLANMAGKSVRVQAVVVDADSLREVPLSAAPAAIDIIPAEQSVQASADVTVPFPWERGCIVVRLAATDEGGDELDDTETPPFDPYDPANAACPRGSARAPDIEAVGRIAHPGI